MPKYLFVFCILIASFNVFGNAHGLQCLELFNSRSTDTDLPQFATELLQNNRNLEAVWWLRDRGFKEQADAIEREVVEDLELNAPTRMQPRQWQTLSLGINDNSPPVHRGMIHNLKNIFLEIFHPSHSSDGFPPITRNTTYLMPVGRFHGVLKLGRHAAIHEVLAYKVARVLEVPVPVTIPVMVDGVPGSFQYYVKDYLSAYSAGLRRAEVEIEPNWQTTFFDFIFRNEDRHSGNYILDLSHSEIELSTRIQLEDAAQILIDNELLFNSIAEPGDTPISEFVRKNILQLHNENPIFTTRLADKHKQQQILDLLRESSLEDKEFVIEHVEIFFAIYNRVFNAHFG